MTGFCKQSYSIFILRFNSDKKLRYFMILGKTLKTFPKYCVSWQQRLQNANRIVFIQEHQCTHFRCISVIRAPRNGPSNGQEIPSIPENVHGDQGTTMLTWSLFQLFVGSCCFETIDLHCFICNCVVLLCFYLAAGSSRYSHNWYNCFSPVKDRGEQVFQELCIIMMKNEQTMLVQLLKI